MVKLVTIIHTWLKYMTEVSTPVGGALLILDKWMRLVRPSGLEDAAVAQSVLPPPIASDASFL